jgi:hypothetical protein
MKRNSTPAAPQTSAGAAQRLKNELAARVVAALDRQGLTLREAAARTGQAAADYSRLRRGQLERFSIERLLGIAEALGEPLTLTVGAAREAGGAMDVPDAVALHLRGLRILCRRFGVRRLGLFGSVLRPDFDKAKSDIDFAVEFGPSHRYGPADQYFKLKEALEGLLQREVDLVEFDAMPDSRLKRAIGRDLVPVYAQAA